MYVIGIAGGIGAGKSVVSRVLRSKGHEVYDCDSEARRMMEASDLLKDDIAARLGLLHIGRRFARPQGDREVHIR